MKQEALLFYGLAAALALAACIRARTRWAAPRAASGKGGAAGTAAIVVAVGVTLVAVAGLVGSSAFFQGEMLQAVHVLAVLLLVSAWVDGILAWLLPVQGAEGKSGWGGAAGALVIGVAALAFVFFARSFPGSSADALLVSLPFEGEWVALSAGRLGLTNHHQTGPPAQRLAVDFVRSDAGTRGQAVLAPVSGTVVRAVSNVTEGDGDSTEGNVVVIRTSNGTEVYLAHLEEGSVAVREGETVVAGQMLARCGATGSAERPHLHIHAERQGQPVPMLFGERRLFVVRYDRVP